MKESFYFPHDNNAHNDPKLMWLLTSVWLAWIWIYWILIEVMHQQEDWKMSEEQFTNYISFYSLNSWWEFVEQVLNIFRTSEIFCFENWKVFSKRVIKNKQFRDDLREKRKKAWEISAKKRALKREEWTSVEQNSTSVEHNPNNKKEIKKKRNKKESKSIIIKNKIFNETDFEYRVAKNFLEKQINNKNTSSIYLYKTKWDDILQEWSQVVENLQRLDKIPQEIIEKVVEFATIDEFWREQFWSMEKFRKKDKNKVPYFIVLANKAKIAIKKEQEVENLVRSWVDEAF